MPIQLAIDSVSQDIKSLEQKRESARDDQENGAARLRALGDLVSQAAAREARLRQIAQQLEKQRETVRRFDSGYREETTAVLSQLSEVDQGVTELSSGLSTRVGTVGLPALEALVVDDSVETALSTLKTAQTALQGARALHRETLRSAEQFSATVAELSAEAKRALALCQAELLDGRRSLEGGELAAAVIALVRARTARERLRAPLVAGGDLTGNFDLEGVGNPTLLSNWEVLVSQLPAPLEATAAAERAVAEARLAYERAKARLDQSLREAIDTAIVSAGGPALRSAAPDRVFSRALEQERFIRDPNGVALETSGNVDLSAVLLVGEAAAPQGAVRTVVVEAELEANLNHGEHEFTLSLLGPNGTSVRLLDHTSYNNQTSYKGGRLKVTFDDAAPKPAGPASDSGASAHMQPMEPLRGFAGLSPELAAKRWSLRLEGKHIATIKIHSWGLKLLDSVMVFFNEEMLTIGHAEPNTVTSRIPLQDAGGFVVETIEVTVDLKHTWVGDLNLQLVAPNGESVVLMHRKGGPGDDLQGTTFADGGADQSESQPPFRGRFAPKEALSKLGDIPLAGEWSLRIADRAPGDGGWLERWEMRIAARVAQPPADSEFRIDLVFGPGISENMQSIFRLAASTWQRAIIGDLPTVAVDPATAAALQLREEMIDDLVIHADVKPIDDQGGTLAMAGPTHVREGDPGLPAIGAMSFDAADLDKMQHEGTLLEVVLHEMGHVLGIGTLWDSHLEGSNAELRFVGPAAKKAWGQLQNPPEPPRPVPVEDQGGLGTKGSHWRESALSDELMTGFIKAPGNPLSAVTIGALKDLGYEVDETRAQELTLPPAIRMAALGAVPKDRPACSGKRREAPKKLPLAKHKGGESG